MSFCLKNTPQKDIKLQQNIGTIFALLIVKNHTFSLRLENSTVTFNITEANFLYQWRAALLSQKSCNL